MVAPAEFSMGYYAFASSGMGAELWALDKAFNPLANIPGIVKSPLGPILTPVTFAATLEGGSNTQQRQAKFSASLSDAISSLTQVRRTMLPDAQKLMTDFVNASQQLSSLATASQGSQSQDVADALQQIAGDYQAADAAITNPIGSVLQMIQGDLSDYNAGKDSIDAWNVSANPAAIALNDLNRVQVPALRQAMAQAAAPLRKLQSDLVSAKRIIDQDVASRKAAALAAQQKAMDDAASTLRDALSAADQAAQVGDFNTAIGVLQDGSVWGLALMVGWAQAINARIQQYAQARSDKQNADQMAQFVAFVRMVQSRGRQAA